MHRDGRPVLGNGLMMIAVCVAHESNRQCRRISRASKARTAQSSLVYTFFHPLIFFNYVSSPHNQDVSMVNVGDERAWTLMVVPGKHVGVLEDSSGNTLSKLLATTTPCPPPTEKTTHGIHKGGKWKSAT